MIINTSVPGQLCSWWAQASPSTGTEGQGIAAGLVLLLFSPPDEMQYRWNTAHCCALIFALLCIDFGRERRTGALHSSDAGGKSSFWRNTLLIQLELAKVRGDTSTRGENFIFITQNHYFRSPCMSWTVQFQEFGGTFLCFQEFGSTFLCFQLYPLLGASRTIPHGSLAWEQLKPHPWGYPGCTKVWKGHLQLLFAMELSRAAPYQRGEEEKDCHCEISEISGPRRSYNSRLSHGEAGGKVGRGLSVKSDSLDNCFTGERAALITTSQLLMA